MRLPTGKTLALLVFSNLIVLASPAFGQNQYTLTPSISVSETYDDNIYLDPAFERSDYITTVTPSIGFTADTQRNSLQLTYAPSIVRYARDDENNTVRHLGSVRYLQSVSQNFRFELSDTYLRSEDPLESPLFDPERVVDSVRRSREPYHRNSGEARMSYVFGPENTLSAGYRNTLLYNDDPSLDDGMTHDPFVDAVYWFDIKHGMGLSYRYTQADFTRDDGTPPQPDYTGHSPVFRYLHRYDPQTTGYVSYAYTTRDFEQGYREDYSVHNFTIGADKQFSPQTAVSAGAGFFIRRPDESESQSGPSFNVSLRKTYQRSRFVISGAGGWDEQYLEAENRGFVEYYSIQASGDYTFLERLSGYASGGWRDDQYEDGLTTNTWRASVGLRWAFYRYLALSLDYTHVSRTSDNPLDEYDNNRVMLIVSGSKPYKWQ